MKTVKRIVAVLLAVVLMAPAAVNAAGPSVKRTSINKKSATTTTVTYTGKSQYPKTVKIGGKTLKYNKDYTIKKVTMVNAKTYKVTIVGIDKYEGTTTVYFKIKKADQKVKTAVSSKSYKASSLKKAKKTFKLKTSAKTKVTYTVSGKNAKKYISVSKSGKVTVKKGIKKGTYKIVIKAKSTSNYNKAQKTVKIVIKK